MIIPLSVLPNKAWPTRVAAMVFRYTWEVAGKWSTEKEVLLKIGRGWMVDGKEVSSWIHCVMIDLQHVTESNEPCGAVVLSHTGPQIVQLSHSAVPQCSP